ncbi:kinase-interacting family protein-like isoform X1 [Cucurbita maxima]|uniref:Kinase-interacting family protein-like isoform X1 n=2 Tax=Cucurbita maxima TaxID=3661 RepID=A0A6J1KHH7_CUCMA|nr:kinase-interacting family protein-like isoform X1 [Cucurbita maxima]XP_022998698.1 kinase-interacting family protein-like isoform X1 [Cucurbita maxima]
MEMVAPEEEDVWTKRTPSSPSCESLSSNRNSITLGPKSPSLLSSSLADMEQKINLLAMKNAGENDAGDSFAERAEFYYNKRPQLLALLQELYTAYTTLSDRYIQTIAKRHNHHHNRHSSVTSTLDSFDGVEDSGISQIESDAESSLSYQQVSVIIPAKNYPMVYNDAFVAEIVIKNVEYDILINEVSILEKQCGDSSTKIELQKSLLEVLESERLILLNENARLGYRVASLMEENKGLVAESVFMKQKASEMARCMLKLRDDHRAYLLNQKIEDLQGQIYGLEKKNREYYEKLAKIDKTMVESISKNKEHNGNEVTLEACFQIRKLKSKRHHSGVINNSGSDRKSNSGRKTYRWWAKVKSMDMFLCGHSTNPM